MNSQQGKKVAAAATVAPSGPATSQPMNATVITTGPVVIIATATASAQRLCRQLPASAPPRDVLDAAAWRGRTWATRASVKVDRMACAWAIRRFIDPAARFRFMSPGESASVDDVTFDLVDATFGHEEGGCSLETLIRRLGLEEPGLGALAELVHDVDCKDGRYGRAEVAGLKLAVDGIAAATRGRRSPPRCVERDQGSLSARCCECLSASGRAGGVRVVGPVEVR